MKVVSTEKLPIKMWLEDIEDGALEQAKNLANLPFAFKHIAIMPDSHQGYGMPIGGVMATKGVIVPNAVGVDIGCGMCAVKTSLTDIDTDTLKKIMSVIRKVIPLGFNKHEEAQEVSLMPKWGDETMLGKDFKLSIVEDNFKNALKQLGTLGGGNHFIEIQKGDDGHIWIMIHSGSRNLGHTVATHYNKLAIKLNRKWHTQVPEKHELAFLPLDSKEGKSYLREMQYCVDYALANRKLMMERICKIFAEETECIFIADYPKGTVASTWKGLNDNILINIAHNYAKMENHCSTCIDNLGNDNQIYESLLGESVVSKVQDFLDGYHPVFHSCGGLILKKGASVLKFSPSQVDVLEQMTDVLHSLPLGLEGKRSHLLSSCLCGCDFHLQTDASCCKTSNKFGLGFCHLFGVEKASYKLDKERQVSSPDSNVVDSHTSVSKSVSSSHGMVLLEKEYRKLDRILGRIFLGFDAYGLDCKLKDTYSITQKHDTSQVMVHRKGATLATTNTVGIIPGSQGTKSYIVNGLGNSDSFNSCSHGAGRRMGRKQAERELDLEAEIKSLDEKGVLHAIRGKEDLDEAPGAYKDISKVMANQRDLVEILVELTPLGVVKG